MCVKGVFGVSGSESGNFRRSAFGGFNRDDVVGYIEKYSAEHRASLAENEKLRSENGELSLKVSELEGKVEKLKADNSELAGAKAEADSLKKTVEEVKDSALAYENTRLRLAAMEVEAARRAADIEKVAMDAAENTLDNVESVVDDINTRFGGLRYEIEVTIAHLRGELAKMNASLDRIAAEIADTDEKLQGLKDKVKSGRELVKGNRG